MSWVGEAGFARRPVVVVEDHLHHVEEVLAALAAADAGLLGQVTILCLDRPGPDTDREVRRWLAARSGLQVAACWQGGGPPERLAPVAPDLFASANLCARVIAGLLRPGGLLLQDVQLQTLRFVPADRWWESIYLASTVRGMFPESPPTCRFLSNKRGYEATFGRDLLDAGFDPRDVLDKRELAAVVPPVVQGFLALAFPLVLRAARAGARAPDAALSTGDADRREVESGLDLVVWRGEAGIEVGGRLVAGDRLAGRRLALKPGSHEAATWLALVADRLAAGPGVPVVEVGRRVAPAGAGRAELTNLAARHLHGLRGRLADGTAIVTEHHAYRLSERLAVGLVEPRPGGR